MNFPVKITLLLFFVMVLLIGLVFGYVYLQLERTYGKQSEKMMDQSADLIQQRLDLLAQNLQSEMDQLSSSLFTENETALTSLLSNPPEYNTEVIGFSEKLRRRTSLDFLRLLSTDGKILSGSPEQAAFGTPDPHPGFPVDQVSYRFDQSTCLALRRHATFGQHTLLIDGGYFLKQELEKIPLQGMILRIEEVKPGDALPIEPASFDATYRTRGIDLKDYQNQPVLRITVAASMKDLLLEKDLLVKNLGWFIVGSMALCLLTGFLLSFTVSRPVRILQDAAREMSSGKLETRVEVAGSGEIANLMQAFNDMAEQLEEKQNKLIQTERIAAWQEIARHLAHEIKNPLTPIRTSITNLRLSLEKAPEKFSEIFLESSGSIMEEVEKLRHLADEFSRFARLPAPSKQPGNLNEIIRKNLVLYPGDSRVSIRFTPGELPVFPFDPEQVSEVTHNLLQNAADAIEETGSIHVRTFADGEQWASLVVEDTGKGMEEQVRRQIFAPYFTTKAKGTGLGLAIVQRIVTEHGGTIFVESQPSVGTKVEIRLPLH